MYLRDAPIFSFNLLPETTHERPAFINIQQYYVEGFLVERALELPLIDLRWKHAVVGVTQDHDAVTLQVQTPDGTVALQAEHVIACDGARSSVRQLIGQEAKGRTFKDRFLIADVKMAADFPAERWFWFDPPFHPGQSVLLHKQPDGVWRIDFQLGWDADPEAEKTTRAHRAARARAARAFGDEGCAVRARMGQRVQLLVRTHGSIPPWPRAVRR